MDPTPDPWPPWAHPTLTAGACAIALVALGGMASTADGPLYVPTNGNLTIGVSKHEPEIGEPITVTVCASNPNLDPHDAYGILINLNSSTGGQLTLYSDAKEKLSTTEQKKRLKDEGATALVFELRGGCQQFLFLQDHKGAALITAQSGQKQAVVALTIGFNAAAPDTAAPVPGPTTPAASTAPAAPPP